MAIVDRLLREHYNFVRTPMGKRASISCTFQSWLSKRPCWTTAALDKVECFEAAPLFCAHQWTDGWFYGSAIKRDLTNMKMDATYTIIDMAGES